MSTFKSFFDGVVANRTGAMLVLAIAAFLEAWGDSFFQIGFYRSPNYGRLAAIVLGVVVLGCYGAMVNTPRWDFGQMLGVYVVFFFLLAQLLNRVRLGHAPTVPVYAGGALIVAGGAVMTFWKP